ncbi:MAG: MarR family winged helix-turn-helix transcriptional regulator [Nitriliruptoraceae bacterium]
MRPDHVDRLTEQWARERPELDTRPLRISARVVRLQRFLDQRIAAALEHLDVSEGEVNVLAALRRAGPPHELTPTELYRGLLLSSSAMTHRIDRLEAHGFVRRIPDDDDRRRVRVALTDAGHELVDAAMDRTVAELSEVTGVLDDEEHAALEEMLRRLLNVLERDEAAHDH